MRRSSIVLAILLGAAPAAAASKRAVAPVVDLARMVSLSAGSFRMGVEVKMPGPYGDAWFVDQQPAHEVQLQRYWLDRTEVTVAEFALFLTYAGGEAHFHPDQPIERVTAGYLPIRGTEREAMRQVSWTSAARYCSWAGKRLPTEAEWERAAAGTSAAPYPWGSASPTCGRAAHFTGATFCAVSPGEVGGHPTGATPDGVEDLAGNVAEWVADWYGPYSSAAQVSPTGPPQGTLRGVRGGGLLTGQLFLRSTARRAAPPEARSEDVGFRCAFDRDESPPTRRGALTPAADEGRQPTRSRPPTAPAPLLLAKGLSAPGAIALLGSGVYVLEATQLSRLGTSPPLLTGLLEPRGLATDGTSLFATDRGTGTIWKVTPDGASTALAQGQAGASLIAASADEAYWATADALRRWPAADAGVDELASGLDGVGGLSLSPSHLYFAETGSAAPGKARVARVARGGAAVEAVVPNTFFGSAYRPTDVAFDPSSGRVYFTALLRSWPSSGYVCSVAATGGAPVCHSYSPPGIDRLAVGAGAAWWSSGGSLVRLDRSQQRPFDVPGTWTRVGGLAVDAEGAVWSDRDTGRVYRSRPF